MQDRPFGLNANNRESLLQWAAEKHWDLVIIGGGITGAGILLDARLRGLDVLLLEQYDFASGTSSRSTKLIHGGLRYLKQFDFGLVREVGRERALLHRNAPHLVEPAPMVLPFVKKGSIGKHAAKFGLWLYEWLAGVKPGERFKTLSTKEAMQFEPMLRDDDLLGAAVYTEYQTDDARLTLSILKTAVQAGGYALNYAKVERLEKENGIIGGVHVMDTLSGKTYGLKANVVVNAAGPWVDEVRKYDRALLGKRLHLTKGVHITVKAKDFPLKHAAYFDGSDGRMIFAIPREGYVYIGTTDTDYEGNPANVKIEQHDVLYLIDAVNKRFKGKPIQAENLVSGWAGIRPLIHQDGKQPSELSRKDEIWESESGLISIAGGKLTGYRVMAKKAVDSVVRALQKKSGRKFGKCKTGNTVLLGGDFEGFDNWQEFAAVQYGEAKEIGVTPDLIRQWVKLFGRETEQIIERAYTIWPEVKNKTEVPMRALIAYLVESEMLISPLDYYERRIGRLGFDLENCFTDFEKNKHIWQEVLKADDDKFKEMEYSFLRALDAIRASLICIDFKN
jgi:glycerol-3-phosphate dehydrogenase